MNKFFILLCFFPAIFYSQTNTADFYYKKATDALNKKHFSEVNKQIDEAIKLDGENLEYRWIKARANLNSNSSEENFILAIDNLNLIISKGGSSAKVLNALGVAENELAKSIRNYHHPKEDQSFKDNDNVKIEQQKIYEESLSHFKTALQYFTKAEEIVKGITNNNIYSVKSDISDLEKKIQDL